jgi:AcrR family transcriptional regulator
MSTRAQEVPQRKSRAEAREETRQRLLDAGLAVFSERGFADTSVEEIAARAGFTRGAFYSNFADKEELFFALMDARMEQRVAEVTEVMESSTPAAVFGDLERWSVGADDDADRGVRVKLFAEFRAHALRSEAVRVRLAERDQALRELYARAITGLFDATGVAVPAPIEDVALIVQVLDNYLPIQTRLEDGAIRDGFLFDALTLLFRAAVALSREEQGG